jgi:hypothetical protein
MSKTQLTILVGVAAFYALLLARLLIRECEELARTLRAMSAPGLETVPGLHGAEPNSGSRSRTRRRAAGFAR